MKIGFLITARLKSSRLPLKLLLDLNGKTMVERVIERVKQVGYVQDVVLCTSINAQDRPLVDIAIKNDIYYYLGDEGDVLKRLKDAAQFFELDYVLNITGENPLFSIEYANLIADQLRSEKYDFVHITGLPIGCACYGLNVQALKVICEVKKEVDTEIWGLLVNRPDVFSVKEIKADPSHSIGDVRITSDYQEDYQLISRLFDFFPDDRIPSYSQVVKILKDNPELLTINAMRKQEALNPDVVKRINEFYEKNKEDVINMMQNSKLTK